MIEPAVKSGLEFDARFLDQLQRLHCLIQGEADRLLAENMLAGLGRFLDDGDMRVRRRADEDS
ncbi:hypothetical protein D3C85_1895730 [compost metagenome]